MAKHRKDSKGQALYTGEYERSDGNYCYSSTKEGKRSFFYASSLEELREKEAELEKKALDGIDTYLAGTATVDFLFDRYMALKRNLRARTKEGYIYTYNHYVRDIFGKTKISEVKYSDMVYLYGHFLNDMKLELNTLKGINRVLYPAFDLAVKDAIIINNPCKGALAAASRKPGKNHGVRKALTLEEQRHFMEYIAKSKQYRHWLPLFTVMLGTGCRVGEIVGLRWEDLDFQKKMIDINHSIVYYPEHGAKTSKSVTHVSLPKTAAGIRKIPMTDKVYEAFLEEREYQKEHGSCKDEIDGLSGFVFCNRYGLVHNPQTINLAIKRISENHNSDEILLAAKQKREPVIIPSFSCHCLRHTFCTRFVENEGNIKVIQEIMGHATYETTLNIYTDISEMRKERAMEELAIKLEK